MYCLRSPRPKDFSRRSCPLRQTNGARCSTTPRVPGTSRPDISFTARQGHCSRFSLISPEWPLVALPFRSSRGCRISLGWVVPISRSPTPERSRTRRQMLARQTQRWYGSIDRDGRHPSSAILPLTVILVYRLTAVRSLCPLGPTSGSTMSRATPAGGSPRMDTISRPPGTRTATELRFPP